MHGPARLPAWMRGTRGHSIRQFTIAERLIAAVLLSLCARAAVPYLAAIIMSLVSALPLPARLIGTPKPTRHQAPVADDDYDDAASRPGNS